MDQFSYIITISIEVKLLSDYKGKSMSILKEKKLAKMSVLSEKQEQKLEKTKLKSIFILAIHN